MQLRQGKSIQSLRLARLQARGSFTLSLNTKTNNKKTIEITEEHRSKLFPLCGDMFIFESFLFAFKKKGGGLVVLELCNTDLCELGRPGLQRKF